ncbi:hypothetical protein HK107_04570 [Parvularcula sp. ZS-1/3]|uniref:Putative auto-transporter adhesin head GIN domain-containing protein n=1 Tax=Parvularcula mediterranea TaxID=2732508 RepID=A0A7Y3W4T8_9PROT|nr:DUF2807 domain-containing protein [Parvularcula mediterranea]NNU15592.1 hypothetical protein [Parvularcula mediterranea]
MKTLSALGVSAAALLAVSSQASAEEVTFDETGFTKVVATAGVDVYVAVGSAFSVTMETKGDPDQARVSKSGDTLTLSREGWKGMNLGRSAKLVYRVTMPSFEGGESKAGSDLFIEGISGGVIYLDSSAGSDIVASGTCDELDAEASSGSDIEAFDLVCKEVTARASSGADIEVTATGSVNAKASSGADVTVRGNPDKIDSRDSSGGSVRVQS